MEYRKVFVTVGTTEFDELIARIDSEDFVNALIGIRCKSLVVQMGRGTVTPRVLPDLLPARDIQYECYNFKPTLSADMEAADLIISHCGAGSILECLTLKKVFIVVVNSTLQGNHQMELADALAGDNYCHSTVPDKLVTLINSTVAQVRSSGLRIYPTADPRLFSSAVEEMFDWPE